MHRSPTNFPKHFKVFYQLLEYFIIDFNGNKQISFRKLSNITLQNLLKLYQNKENSYCVEPP